MMRFAREGGDTLNVCAFGFTLIEVLVATIILSLGLIGIAAIFPAVIVQQQRSNDQAQSVSVSLSAEAALSNRLSALGSSIRHPGRGLPYEDGWVRINMVEIWIPGRGRFLQAPYESGVDLRLSELVEDFPVTSYGQPIIDGREFAGVVLENLDWPSEDRPMLEDDADQLRVHIKIYNSNSDEYVHVTLMPLEDDPFVLTVAQGGEWRLDPTEINGINYAGNTLDFHVMLKPSDETVESVTVDYVWRNDRVLSHVDRLFPAENPKYGWDMVVRNTLSGNPQYCLFVYRFAGGPRGAVFHGDPVDSWNSWDQGMVRLGKAVLVQDKNRFYLVQPSDDLEDALKSGTYILPCYGVAPVKIRRRVEDDINGVRWELESPPLEIDEDGNMVLYGGGAFSTHAEYYYIPLEIPAYDGGGVEIGTWKIKPLVAYAKPLDG